MNKTYEQQQGNMELWQQIFSEGHPALLKQHWIHKKLPLKPRCRLCLVPFRGIGGWIMRKRGKAPNSRNPNYCNACDKFLQAYPGGSEVEMSVLFADIRQSTQFADAADAAAVGQRINQFLDIVTKIIADHDGFIMAFYGDCIVAAWPPGFSGNQHAQKAQQAAKTIVSSKKMTDTNGKKIPVGVGVHSGKVFIGTVSAMQGTFRDVSIFGINVNIAARLASQAVAGQALVSEANILTAGTQLTTETLQEFELKGISESVKACVLS